VPAYWVVLLVVGVLMSAALVRADDGRLTLGNLLTRPGALLSDALLIQNDIPATTITGIGPAWTLAIEVVFYVVLPLLALPLLVLATRRRALGSRVALALVAPLALLALGLAAKASVLVVPSLAGEGWSDDWSGVLHRSFAYNADLFAPGMVAGVAAVLIGSGTLVVRAGARRAMLVAAAVLVAAATAARAAELVPSATYETLAAIGFGLLMLSLATGERSRIVVPLESRPLVFVGLVSYSVFLWHEPVTRWLAARGATLDGVVGIPVNLALVLALVLPLSYASYRLVERPAMGLRRARSRGRAGERRAPSPT
jgi:peptidoglycan/LPS O-acetylase OafA/YrhL